MDDQFLLRRGHAVKGLFGQMMQDKLVKGENPDPVASREYPSSRQRISDAIRDEGTR